MSASDPIKKAWQESVTDAALPSLEMLRAGADRFYRNIRLRNRIEYGAAIFVVVAFAAIAFMAPSPFAKAGALLVMLGTLFVVWQLHRRASATLPPGAEAALPILVHQRREMVRQRDALASIWLWYLLPLLPGLLLMQLGPSLGSLTTPPRAAIIAVLINVAVFGGVWLLNHLAARRLQRALDEIDALLGETE